MECDDIEERAGQMIDTLESKINNLENIRNTLRIENRSLSAEVAKLNQRVKILTNGKIYTHDEWYMMGLYFENKSLKTENESLKGRIGVLDDEIDALKGEISVIETERDNLKKYNEKLTEQLNEMIQKIMEKSKNDINNAENGGEHADE